MPQWEYRKIDLNDLNPKLDDIHLLNAAGQDGWELLAIMANNFAYLKRPVDALPATQQASARALKRSAKRTE